MNITKYGHSCLFIEEQELRIVVDPGNYSTMQNQLHEIDILIITHEHADHFDLASVTTMVKNNPAIAIFTTAVTSETLKKENIIAQVVKHGDSITKKNITIEFFGRDHALIHSSIPLIENIGYFIAGRLFYPGDAFTNPQRPVDILALPMTAPWLKISETIDYAIEIKPKVCFPVHDGNAKNPSGMYPVIGKILNDHGITLQAIELDKRYEF